MRSSRGLGYTYRSNGNLTQKSEEQPRHVAGCGPGREDLERERDSREAIEDSSHVKAGPEELLDFAQVHHPNVMHEAGSD